MNNVHSCIGEGEVNETHRGIEDENDEPPTEVSIVRPQKRKKKKRKNCEKKTKLDAPDVGSDMEDTSKDACDTDKGDYKEEEEAIKQSEADGEVMDHGEEDGDVNDGLKNGIKMFRQLGFSFGVIGQSQRWHETEQVRSAAVNFR